MARLSIVICLTAVFGLAAPADACECLSKGTEVGAVQDTDLVFSGRVVASEYVLVDTVEGSIFHEDVGERTGHLMRVAVIRVDNVFKGRVGPFTTVITGSGAGDCGYPFETAKTYLIFARRTKDKELAELAGNDQAITTSICSFTRVVESDAASLAVISKAYPSRKPTWASIE
jgi:hypothetical protein